MCSSDLVICGFEFLEGLAVLAEKDICAGLPERVRTGYPCADVYKRQASVRCGQTM